MDVSTIGFETDQISSSESGGSVRVAFVVNGDLSDTVRITFGVTSDSATDGVDFLSSPLNGYEVTTLSSVDKIYEISLQPGENRKEIVFQINDDAMAEATESFVVSIINVDGEGAELGAPRTVSVDILDDDEPIVDPPPPPSPPVLESAFDVSLEAVVDGLSQPIAFEFLATNPDILFVAEKRGTIQIYDMSATANGGAPVRQGTILDIQGLVNDRQDRGLLDIAIHPDLANNPYLYAFYVVDPDGVEANGGGNRFSHLVRYTLDAASGYTSIVEDSATVILGGGARTIDDISGRGAIDSTLPANENIVASDIEVQRDANGVAQEPYNVADPLFKTDVLKVDSRSHAGGALAFGPDGALYVSVGDGTSFNYADPRTFYVQDIDSLVGKILRIDPITGLGLADNPFVEAGDDLAGNSAKVFQLGLRNPFSMGFDEDGRLFIADTGWEKWEEINTGGPGANFGWPFYQGGDDGESLVDSQYNNRAEVQNGTFTAPSASEVTPAFRAFSHDNNSSEFQIQAITGGDVVYSGDVYPESFDGSYFFADVSQGEIFAVNTSDRDDVGFLIKREGALAPVHFSQGPDGYVYYADIAFGNIGRLHISSPGSSGGPITQLTSAQEAELIKLYIGYFNRAPELVGLEFHKTAILEDLNSAAPKSFDEALLERADHFFDAAIAAPEFSGYSASDTTAAFVETIYENALLRPGEGGEVTQSEVDYWVAKIDSGEVSRGALVLEFFAAQPILLEFGTSQEKAVADTTLKIIENRITVAREFAKPENSEGLVQAAAHDAGVAALEGVDETQASVDAALARLQSSNATDNSTSGATLAIAMDDGVESSDAVVAPDIVPDADDMLIA
ncbi:MAG: PQQ-dependent sugar dehydrogenase [Hyphomicrobiaceae bacterium]